jgi:GTP-binding protein
VKKRSIVAESREASHRSPPATAPAAASKPPQPLVGAEFIIAAAAPAQWPPAGPAEIAFAGRSNAGKSSAINALARRNRLAFASRTPGRTQQIVFFALAGGARAADLPGYGYAAVARDIKREWQRSLWQYVTTRSTLVGLVLVVDARQGLKPLDLSLLDGFMPSGRPVLVLATKSDKLNNAERRDAVAAVRGVVAGRYTNASAVSVVLFSAQALVGVEDANAVLAEWLPARS